MVELIVALLAGLIVAAGIVTLSREATNTFHEEARASAAEAGLRAAMDRLRADLSRAGFMSTGNILTDPSIAVAPGALRVQTAPAGIKNLAALYYKMAGSQPNLPTTGPTQSNPVTPDLIQVAGNMTSADQFDVAYIAPPSGNCVQIFLSPTSPAMYRLIGNGLAGAAELQGVFQPDPAQAAQFMVRLVDGSGRSQFLPTAGTSPGAGCVGAAAGLAGTQPWVMVDVTNTPLQTAQTTGTVGGLSGYSAGRAWVNPVQIVQWEITSSSASVDTEPAQFLNGLEATPDGGADPTKYDLMRSYIGANGSIVSTTSEIVAEYAVDLGFAFSVDTGTALNPSIVTYAFNDANNGTVGAAVGTTNATPQRVRAIRARLAVRTAQPDRSVNIAVSPTNYGSETYLYRYCVLAQCAGLPAGALAWARVRTLTTEVNLPNQSANYY